jgi:hypothetical protein
MNAVSDLWRFTILSDASLETANFKHCCGAGAA